MVSQALKKYKKLISEMPLSEHLSTSKKKIWKNKKNCKGIVRLLFVDKEESVTISRKEVFDYAKDAANENVQWKNSFITLLYGVIQQETEVMLILWLVIKISSNLSNI